MVTINTRPTTLAQYKTALDLSEASQGKLTEELNATRKTNAQLSADLKASQLSASLSQEQLVALQQSSKKDLEAERKTNAQLSADLKASQLSASLSQEQLVALQRSSQAELVKMRKDATALEKQLATAQAEATKAQADAAKAQASAAKAQDEAAKAQADKAAAEAKAGQQLADASELLSRQKLAAVAAADREVKLSAEIAGLRKQLEQVNTVGLTASDTSEQLAQLSKQIDALVAENRRMAESRDQLMNDQQALATTIERQKLIQTQAVDKARAEVQLAARQEIDQLQETLRLGQSRLATLTNQLQSAGKLEVLAPEQVGALMGGFLKQMEGGMPSLRLAEGELKLKLGLASSGTTQGFVILQPDARVDAQATVHEVALKFDRSGMLNLPVAK